MKPSRATIGGTISTIAMFAASSGKIYLGGFLMALGVAVLYRRKIAK